MIRVHCFVSCVCESLKRDESIDERPFYFGVWDAEFSTTAEYQLAYHSADSDQSFFCEWYERLYGPKVHPWYDKALSKDRNIERLIELVESRPARRNVLVMLDLFRLPERENKFNQNPFPHYVMLQTTERPEEWLMQDPDFRWEGRLPKQRILDAIASPSVAGGYYFEENGLHAPEELAIRSYFEVCLREHDNPFQSAIRSIVHAHLDGRAQAGLPGLTRALREIPVLAIRKYAYEHGFAFFWRAGLLDEPEFLAWCDAGEDLVKTFTTIQYRAMKLATTRDRSLAPALFALLDHQDQLEFRLKRRLMELFRAWCSRWEVTEPRVPARAFEQGAES